MSSMVAFPVPSCSGSAIRKRRNDSDSDSSGVKRPKFVFVLESESDIPSSEEETESISSLQNKSTDFAKDTSDTSSKSSHYDSEFDVEYEVVSLSEPDVKLPFDSYSSGSDMGSWKKISFEDGSSDDSENSMWADNSSAPEDPPGDLIPLRQRPCLKCKAPTTCVQYCYKCYKVRKDFFPPRPKFVKRKKILRTYCRKNYLKELPKTPSKEKVESGIESGSSQEIMLTPEEKNNNPTESEGLCNVCFKNPKNGAFVHCRWVHIFSCYECSIKIWFSSRVCPLCNGKINKVLKVGMA